MLPWLYSCRRRPSMRWRGRVVCERSSLRCEGRPTPPRMTCIRKTAAGTKLCYNIQSKTLIEMWCVRQMAGNCSSSFFHLMQPVVSNYTLKANSLSQHGHSLMQLSCRLYRCRGDSSSWRETHRHRLFVHANGILGLVKDGLVGVGVLLAGSLVLKRLAGGLLAVRDNVTGRLLVHVIDNVGRYHR